MSVARLREIDYFLPQLGGLCIYELNLPRKLKQLLSEEYTDTGTELVMVMAKEDVNRLVKQYGQEILKK